MATDLKPNRLEAVKNVAANFIKNRPNDRIEPLYMQVKVTQERQLPQIS